MQGVFEWYKQVGVEFFYSFLETKTCSVLQKLTFVSLVVYIFVTVVFLRELVVFVCYSFKSST